MSGWLLNEVVIVMKQEDKELLLRDICARLPYGIKIEVTYSKDSGSSLRARLCSEGINILDTNILWLFQQSEIYIKPYLFPLSSMTEEQLNDFYATIRPVIEEALDSWKNDKTEYEGERPITLQDIKADIVAVNWMLKNHFDYRGLIPMGLAIDANGKNIY